MKVRKLNKKRLVKFIGGCVCVVAFVAVMVSGLNNMRDQAKSCDQAKGHICSVYELHNYRGQ